MGLSGWDMFDGVTMHIDDGGRANRINLCSSRLALMMIGHNILLILSVRKSPNKLSARSFWNQASFSNFCAVC